MRWFQLYVYKDRATTRSLVERAEAAGYSALCLTVDTPILGRRLADVRNKCEPVPLVYRVFFSASIMFFNIGYVKFFLSLWAVVLFTYMQSLCDAAFCQFVCVVLCGISFPPPLTRPHRQVPASGAPVPSKLCISLGQSDGRA